MNIDFRFIKYPIESILDIYKLEGYVNVGFTRQGKYEIGIGFIHKESNYLKEITIELKYEIPSKEFDIDWFMNMVDKKIQGVIL